MIVYVDPRTCVDCGLDKPGDCFDMIAPRKDGSRGRRPYCRTCRSKRYSSANRERARRQRERLGATAEGRETMRRASRESKRRRRLVSHEAHERAKAASRDWERRAYNEDPKYRRRVLAKQKRRRARIRRQRRGEARLRVSVGPLLEHLDVKVAELDGGLELLGEVVNLDAGVFRRWRRGEQATVKLDSVDRILTRLGEPYLLDVLYPEVDELLAGAGV